MWQKALFTPSPKTHPEVRLGIWVKAEPPATIESTRSSWDDKVHYMPTPLYVTNVKSKRGSLDPTSFCSAKYCELLAEFAEDVPIEPRLHFWDRMYTAGIVTARRPK